MAKISDQGFRIDLINVAVLETTMGRPSGILVFASVYSVCILVIICLLQIKYDVCKIQNDPLISPRLHCLEEDAGPIDYVVMNPIKGDFPVQLAKSNSKPNILTATLPSATLPGENVSLSGKTPKSLPAKSQAKVLKSQKRFPVARKMSTPTDGVNSPSGFSFASHTGFGKKNPKKARSRKVLALPGNSVNPVSPDPHVLVSNDFDEIQNLLVNLNLLSHIPMDRVIFEKIHEAFQELSDQGSIDAGICESALYRILSATNHLVLANENDEDSRLMKSVQSQIQSRVYRWIDLLNGIPGEGIPGEGIPGEGIPGEGIPGEGIPGEGEIHNAQKRNRDSKIAR